MQRELHHVAIFPNTTIIVIAIPANVQNKTFYIKIHIHITTYPQQLSDLFISSQRDISPQKASDLIYFLCLVCFLNDCNRDLLWILHLHLFPHSALQPLVCTLICSYENLTLLYLKVTLLSPALGIQIFTYYNFFRLRKQEWYMSHCHWWKPNAGN